MYSCYSCDALLPHPAGSRVTTVCSTDPSTMCFSCFLSQLFCLGDHSSSAFKILKRQGLASERTFLKAFTFAYLASAQSVLYIVLAHVMHFLILTTCVGLIPERICPSPRSMMWFVHYAHVKGLPPQLCRAAQSLPPPQLMMRHKAHESLQTVHRHWTMMSKVHHNSPKPETSLSLLFCTCKPGHESIPG